MKIEIDDKYVILSKIFTIAAIIFILLLFLLTSVNNQNEIQTLKMQLEEQKVITTPIPTPTPSLPTSITFTALSSSVSTGQYHVYTTDGKTLIFSNYASWNEIYPRETYVADVTIQNGIYYTNGAIRISKYGYAYDDYSYYNDRYYNDRYNRYYQDRNEWTPNGEKCIFAHCG